MAVICGVIVLASAPGAPAIAAADQPVPMQISLADDVVPAPDGFVRVTGNYVTTRATALYISPFLWAGKVKDIHLGAGQAVEVFGQAKGYDWLRVGRNGAGIGYLPRSVVAETQK